MSLWKLLYIHDCSYGCTKVQWFRTKMIILKRILDGLGRPQFQIFRNSMMGFFQVKKLAALTKVSHVSKHSDLLSSTSDTTGTGTCFANALDSSIDVATTDYTGRGTACQRHWGDGDLVWLEFGGSDALCSKMITKTHLLILSDTTVYWYYCTLFCPCGTGITIGSCGRLLIVVG